MKKMLFALSVIWLFTDACTKESVKSPFQPTDYVGTTSWEMTGGKWNGVASAVTINGTRTSLHMYKHSDKVNFEFYDFKLEAGHQKLYRFSQAQGDNLPYSFFYHGSEGAFNDAYQPMELDSLENFIELTKIDLENNEVEGKYQVVFAIDTSIIPVNPIGDPDTLVLLNGVFKTLICK